MQPCGGGGGSGAALVVEYRSLLARGLHPPAVAFPPLLRVCASSTALLPLGLSLHQHALLLGHVPGDPFLSSSLLHFYSSAGSLSSARRVFEEMPTKSSVVLWSALIAAFSRAGCPLSAFSLLRDMRRNDVRPNSITFLSLLPLDLVPLQCLHASIVRCGLDSDLALANSLVNAYGRCGGVSLARTLFDSMPERDVISWNSILSGYSKAGRVQEAFYLFAEMRRSGILADHRTYGSLVSAIVAAYNGGRGEDLVRLGKLVHAALLTSGHGLDAHVETALVGMYLKLGDYEDAFLLFDRSSDRRDAVSWSAMISGLLQSGGADKALVVFQQMVNAGMVPAASTLASALSACAQLGSSDVGASIHGHMIRQGLQLDVAAQNSLVSMYAKCGRLRQSLHLFETMADRDLVSWNSVISGCAQNCHLAEAFSLFDQMKQASETPDAITVVSLLHVCASMGALHHGKLVHGFTIRHEIPPTMSLDTSLVDMYAKCGDLGAALRCFTSMPEKDHVSWGAIIAGYGSHGMGELALRAYEDFCSKGMQPNDVIFLAVLSACSHAGLVSEGLKLLKSATEQFALKPSIEHWGCVVDLLCRAGRLEEALGFASTMSPRPTADVLGILLDACRANGLVPLAEEIAGRMAALRPADANSYVQLVQSCAAMQRWDGVGESWLRMRARGLKKAPAWSYVELNGVITAFFAEHRAHPRQNEIDLLLKLLGGEMRGFDELPTSSQQDRQDLVLLDLLVDS